MNFDFLDIAEQYAPCFFACRRPNSTEIIYGDSDDLLPYGSPGFVIMPFTPEDTPFVIPFGCNSNRRNTPTRLTVNQPSTLKSVHISSVETARKIISESKNISKLVVSRIETHSRDFSLSKVFDDLLNKYPDAFVFCFATPIHGIWIGASPELLMSYKAGIASTVALAGTRPTNTMGEWSSKNISEQQIVSDYILNSFRSFLLTPRQKGPEIRTAGPVEHLCSIIFAFTSPEKAAKIPFALSPTPALAGYPKEDAIQKLKRIENHERGCYGGFVGLYISDAEFVYYVNLRSANMDNAHFTLFVGGGIIEDSVPEEEWLETVRKAETLLSVFPH